MTHFSDSAIILDRVTLRIRDRLLFQDTSWRIEAGQHWAIIGPNGSGKTTLAGALAGRVPVVGGGIHLPAALHAEDTVGYVSWERQRGTVLRDAGRDEARSFSGRSDDVLRVRGLFADWCRPDALRSPIAMHWDRALRSLSSGERLLVFLVREVLKRPRLLVLDEPFAGLDDSKRRWLHQVLEDRIADGGMQLILVTHRIREIVPGISHVLAVNNGQIRFCGRRQAVLTPSRLQRVYGRHPQSGNPPRQAPPPAVRDGAIVEMRNVTVRYHQRTVLRDIDWKICHRQNWAVIGPNGSGKSTLMRMIAGEHLQAYANDIYWFGRRRGSGETIWEIRKEIGMVSAELQLYYHRPVRSFDVVLSGFFDSVGLYRQADVEQRETALRWMRHLRVDSLAERRFDTLSGGEQKAVLMARALVKAPRLLILDEPCQGLDRWARSRFRSQIERIGFDDDVQLVYVTHFPGELPDCMTHCLRLVPLADGSYTAEAVRREPSED